MNTGKTAASLSLILLFYSFNQPNYGSALSAITQSQNISVGETLTSSDQTFELGFFNRGNSSRQYVGIWYKKIPVRKIVWVANRETPIKASDRAASLAINQDGNLVILDGNQKIVWSSNISASANASVAAVLQENGDLVLKDVVRGDLLWESFRYPCDTIIPGMRIGMNRKTGERRFLYSSKTEHDPEPGDFVHGFSGLQSFIWNKTMPYWRSGKWNGIKHIGIPLFDAKQFLPGFVFVEETEQGAEYFTYGSVNSSLVQIAYLTPSGSLELTDWNEDEGRWIARWKMPESPCDVYGVCGPFGVCKKSQSPICRCLNGFVPKFYEWEKGNWTGGCVRRTELLCDTNKNKTASNIQRNDGFLRLRGMKLPDFSDNQRFETDNTDACEQWCLNNCSCIAYAYVAGIRCMFWAGELLDIQEFWTDDYGEALFLRLANSELGDNRRKIKLIISLLIACSIFFLGIMLYATRRWKAIQKELRRKRMKKFDLPFSISRPRGSRDGIFEEEEDLSELELPLFNFNKIKASTNNFCIHNKIGEGGFGPVFKGKLQNGQEIAVKRLSSGSGQGIEEFKNEIRLVSKLQHKNLVRLLGCCIEGEELLIIYEYMANKSLDTLLFDATKKTLLDWPKRFNIIQGIARGLLYLHRDSCLKIIHRDLKVSNILLDESLNPKISDFGSARTFQGAQELANTHRVIGTFGYMSPEYVMSGTFSEKSDIFSYGVLLLEIISGKKNTNFSDHEEHLNLLDDAWQCWSKNRELDFMDPILYNFYSAVEVMRCLHVGLLCVQDHAVDRPTMSEVVFMLSSETNRPQPKQPRCTSSRSSSDHVKERSQNICSTNEITISMLHGR